LRAFILPRFDQFSRHFVQFPVDLFCSYPSCLPLMIGVFKERLIKSARGNLADSAPRKVLMQA
jgi:hypothetical protein